MSGGGGMRRLVVAVVVWLLVLSGSAFAASGGGEQVGQHLGDLLGGWAKSLFAGVTAIVSVMFLVNRRFAELGVFICAAIVVGGFVLAPRDIAGTIHAIWSTLTG
jgi:hypothetical protein